MTKEKKCTLSGNEPKILEEGKAPDEIDPKTGKYKDYWVLCPEERAKGFIRPVRQKYNHVGIRPKYPTRELTPEEHEKNDVYNYVVYEKYPEDDESPVTGRFWTKEQLNSGCGSTTIMNIGFAETYARNPSFYGSTFCANCGKHFPVGEFVWDGTVEKVGT